MKLLIPGTVVSLCMISVAGEFCRNICPLIEAFLMRLAASLEKHQALTMETQKIKQPEQDQVCVCSRGKHTGTHDNQPAAITPNKVSCSTEEIFQEVKVRRAEALRLLPITREHYKIELRDALRANQLVVGAKSQVPYTHTPPSIANCNLFRLDSWESASP